MSTTKRPTRNVTAADLGLRGSEDLFEAGARIKRERDQLLKAANELLATTEGSEDWQQVWNNLFQTVNNIGGTPRKTP